MNPYFYSSGVQLSFRNVASKIQTHVGHMRTTAYSDDY